MKNFRIQSILSLFFLFLTVISALTGLFTNEGGGSFTVTSLYGEETTLFGKGLYTNESAFKAPILMGTDAATLCFAVPLMITALILNRKKSFRYRILHLSLTSYFIYYSASLAFGAVFNQMYLFYLLIFSSSLFCFIFSVYQLGHQHIKDKINSKFPRRSNAVFLIIAGMSVFVWLLDLIPAMLEGKPPIHISIYTTEPTFILDIGIIAPSAFISAYLLIRRHSLGYITTPVLLTLNALIGAVVILQTIFQKKYSVSISTGELLAFVIVFAVTSLFAAVLNLFSLKNISH